MSDSQPPTTVSDVSAVLLVSSPDADSLASTLQSRLLSASKYEEDDGAPFLPCVSRHESSAVINSIVDATGTRTDDYGKKKSEGTGGTVDAGSVLEHVDLTCTRAGLSVGAGSLLSGVRGRHASSNPVRVPDGMMFQMLPVRSDWVGLGGRPSPPGKRPYVMIFLGVQDVVGAVPPPTLYGVDLDYLMDKAVLRESEFWDVESVPPSDRNLWNAKIHPVIYSAVDSESASLLELMPISWISSAVDAAADRSGSVSGSGGITGLNIGFHGPFVFMTSVAQWRSSPRLSLRDMAEGGDMIDVEEEKQYRDQLKSVRLPAVREGGSASGDS